MVDWKKVGKGAVVATVGALLTYLTEWLTGADFGPWTAVIVTIFSVVANIVRKWLAGLAVASIAFALMLPASDASAGTVPDWSWGPTVPFFTGEWDSTGVHGGFHGGLLNAGAGVSLNRNFFPNDTGSISKLTLGIPLFINFQGGDPSNLKIMPGLTVGTLNNLIAAGVAFRIVDVANGTAPRGLLVDGIDKEDFVLLLSFNINIGSGTTKTTHQGLLHSTKVEQRLPNYWKPW